MLQKLRRKIKRLTRVVCKYKNSLLRRRPLSYCRRRLLFLRPLSGFIVCALFPLCLIYLNGIPAVEEELATKPPRPLIANRSQMFSNQIMQGDDRRMIVLLADKDADLRLMETLLTVHSRALYLGNVDALPSLQTLSLLGGDRSRLLPSLMDCSKDSLAHLVDYANDRLLDRGEAPWCSLRLRQAHRDSDSKDVYCRPATKLRFIKLCRSNHIAVRFDSLAPISDYISSNDVKSCCYRIVKISSNDSGLDPGWHPNRHSSFPGQENPEIYDSDTHRTYPRNWFKTGNVVKKVVELFNFLDLYLDDQTLQWLEFLGHKVNFPTLPQTRLSPAKTNRTRSRPRLKSQSLPIEVM